MLLMLSLLSSCCMLRLILFFFFFQAEDGIRDKLVTGVQTCALPIYRLAHLVGEVEHRHRVIRVGGVDLFGADRLAELDVPLRRQRNEPQRPERSEERRVGKECRSRWSAYE